MRSRKPGNDLKKNLNERKLHILNIACRTKGAGPHDSYPAGITGAWLDSKSGSLGEAERTVSHTDCAP
jgi:hypothetical protein